MRLRRWKVHKLGFKDFSGIEYINKKLPMPADTQAGAQASLFASQRSYECMDAESAEKDVTPIARIRAGLEATLDRVPQRARLLNMIVERAARERVVASSRAGKLRGICHHGGAGADGRQLSMSKAPLARKTPELKPADANYGAYYLSASHLNFGEEESPALLLLWSREEAGWKIVAWAVEVPGDTKYDVGAP